MTAPGSGEQITAELAEALPPHQTWCQTIGHFDCCGKTNDDCDCGITESLAAILEVVEAYATRKAAEELRAAVAEIEPNADGGFESALRFICAADRLRARADALTATHPDHGKAMT